MRVRRFLLTSIVLAALALAGAYALWWLATDPGLPPLPEVDPSSFAPGVREQVEEALAAARADPRNPAAVGKLGMVLHAYGEFGSAGAAYGRARALEPESFAWIYYHGRVLARTARAEEGFEVLQEAASLRPEYAPLWIELGDLLLAQGDPAEAILYYRAALKHDPQSAIGRYGLGQALKARGQTGAAAEEYREALALAPQFGAAHYALALAARDLGEEEQARRHFGLYQSHQQTLAPARDPLIAAVVELKRSAMTHTTRATELAGAGKTDEAIEELLAALELDPQYLPAHANLIQFYSNQNRFDKAERHFRAAVASGSPAPTARLHYARSLIQQQRLLEAVPVLEELLAINPYTAEGHVLLGSILDEQGHGEEAIRHYRTALENAPNYPQANLGIALHLLRAGDLAAAEPYVEKALRIGDFDRGLVQYRVALAYGQAGHPVTAVAYLQAARQSATAAGRWRLVAEVDRALGEWKQRVGAR